MGKKFDVVAVNGSFQKDCAEKLRYKNIGVVIETDKGLRLKIETPIVFDDEGKVIQWFGLYEPRDNQQAAPAQKQAKEEFFDDDIAF